MLENIENLKLLYVSQGKNKSYKRVRKNHGLIYRSEGTGIYHFADRDMVTQKGDFVFVPNGTECSFEIPPENNCQYISFAFDGEIQNPRAAVFSSEDFSQMHDLCHHLVNWWKFGDAAEKYKCHALFYQLLAHLSKIEGTDYATRHKFSIIEPAEQYLKSHIYDCALSTDALHCLCGISDTYFRKIFIKKHGLAPQKYITHLRLSQAMLLLENGDVSSISSLAHSVGYADPLYFSRIFKQKYGVSPSKFNM